ncbi:putative mitochondrial protein [Andalucia godoyi]|uniref:Putative mitochondrial protein n=1 Tax=Andalucia godoyi TaxID=505711 RepID=A0A8K0F257_ANDGO|nr:putative mitochondrial protein [Andalucia godoyi]|eukprot:ANDGO_00568.mRNA.1 putative mitochondrial protein
MIVSAGNVRHLGTVGFEGSVLRVAKLAGSPSLHVRRAEPGDVREITRLVNDAYLSEAHLKIGPRTSEEEVEEIIRDGRDLSNGVLYVASVFPDGSAAREMPAEWLSVQDISRYNGLVLAMFVQSQEPFPTVYFGLLSIHPGLQRVGIGKAVIALLESCVQRTCKAVEEVERLDRPLPLRMRLAALDLRYDLREYYAAMGYKFVQDKPFPKPNLLKQPCCLAFHEKPLF